MADSQLEVTTLDWDELTPQLKSIESQLIRFVGAVSSAISAIKIGTFPIKQAADFQRELANVTKTTSFTGFQIETLRDKLAQLSLTTDTSAIDLAKIAAAAGQQGLGKEGVDGIVKFTDSVARMASVLDLSAQDSATAIGKILNIFAIPLREVERVSSAINQVSNNSTAKATELLNVLKRLGDAGGALKFTQSLALSATAIDLGATPEVAGTTLSKFINSIKVRNKNFVDLLKATQPEKFSGLTPDKLAELVQEDAFGTFKEVMTSLSKVKLTDRQAAINKLFGGGRITALMDKFLQDILKNTSVLDKNTAQAEGGFASGQSSIKEQATVMATLVKQVDILKNSFKELGRQAGEEFLGPLAGYVAQLRVAIQGEQFRSFARAAVAALGELVGMFVSLTKVIAGMNINWENFLKVLKVFVDLKIAKVILGILSGLPAVGGIFGSLLGATKASGDAATKAGQEGAAGAKKQQTAYQALRAELGLLVRDYKAVGAAAAEQAAQAAAAAAKIAAKNASDASLKASQPNLNRSQVAIKQQQAALDAAILSRQAVNQQGGKDILNATAAGQLGVNQVAQAAQAKQQAAEAAHQKAMADIQAKYAGARTKALKAARDAEFAAEEIHYNRQVAALQVAGAKQIANAETSAAALLAITTNRVKAEIEAENLKVAAQEKALKRMEVQAKIAAQNAAQLARIAGNNAAGVAPATPNPNGAVVVPIVTGSPSAAAGAGAAAAATAGAAAATAGASRVSTALSGVTSRLAAFGASFLGIFTNLGGKLAGIGAALTGLFTSIPRFFGLIGVGLRFVLSSLGPIYLAFIVITSILDALGVMDKLPGFFRDLGDALGFTSNQRRKEEQARQDAIAQHKKEEEAVNDLIERYNKLKDAKGQISEANIDKVKSEFKGATSSNDVDVGVKDLLLMLEGANAEKKKLDDALARGANGAADKAQAQVAKAAADVEKTKKALEALKKEAENPVVFDEGTVLASRMLTTSLENELAKQKEIYDRAVANAKTYGSKSSDALRQAADQQAAEIARINGLLAGTLTPATKTIFDEALAKLIPLKKELEDLKAAAKPDGTSPDAGNPNMAKLELAKLERDKTTDAKQRKLAQDRVNAIQDEIAAKEAIISNFLRQLDANINKLGENSNKTLGGILRASGQYVLSFLNGTSAQLNTLATASAKIPTSVVTNAPALVNPLIGKRPTATTAFDAKSGNSGESEARKLAKARYELQKAELVARFELQKQYNDAFLAEEQRMYDRGLLDLRQFYAEKEAVDMINLENEIKLKEREIAAKVKEKSDPNFKQSDKVKIDAEIVALNGQKAVLQAKLEDIPNAARETVRKAIKEFNESTLTDKLDIMHSLGLDTFSQQLEVQLELNLSQAEVKLARFKTELKKGTPGITQAFIEAFRLNTIVKSVDEVLQSIATHTDTAIRAVENRVRRIQFAQSTGQLTDIQAQQATNEANAQEAEAVREQIQRSEEVRTALIKKVESQEFATESDKEAAVAALKSSDAYRKQTNDIDALKQKYVELKTVVDETASSINKSIETSFADLFKGLADGTGGGLKAALTKFGKAISDTILGNITKDWSQKLMQALDSTGTGGIGGFFSNLFGMNPKGTIDKEMLGRTASTAMYVQDINAIKTAQGEVKTGNPVIDNVIKLFGGDKSIANRASDGSDGNGDISLGGGSIDGVPTDAGVFEKAKSIFSDGFSGLSDSISGFGDSFLDGVSGLGDLFSSSITDLFSTLGGSIGDLSGSLMNSLGSLFSGLGDTLGSLFSAGGSAAGGSGGFAEFAAMIASFFHDGGVIGGGVPKTMSVNPMVFAHAVRYHTGGIAGLQPDEVPSILKKGEEVLTANDPRHRNNGGADYGGTTIHAPVNMYISTPDANSFRQSQDQIATKAGLHISRTLNRNT